MSGPRCTVAGVAAVGGVGLFTGVGAGLRVVPGESGIEFVARGTARSGRTTAPVRAVVANVGPAPRGIPGRNTTLAGGGSSFVTVEHVLSALVGLGITDAVVELDGPEVPIGDGSSAPFVEAIVRAGVRPLSGAAREIRITREITVESGGGRITARPREGGGCAYRYELEYGAGAAIPAQSAEWDSGARDRAARYAREVAPARTFCLEAEAKALRAAGLFRHLSAREMLVIGERGPIENSYRFSDEPARHKLLDLIGDLALVGGVLVGEVVAVRSGHALNHEMARALVDRCGG